MSLRSRVGHRLKSKSQKIAFKVRVVRQFRQTNTFLRKGGELVLDCHVERSPVNATRLTICWIKFGVGLSVDSGTVIFFGRKSLERTRRNSRRQMTYTIALKPAIKAQVMATSSDGHRSLTTTPLCDFARYWLAKGAEPSDPITTIWPPTQTAGRSAPPSARPPNSPSWAGTSTRTRPPNCR